MEVDSGQAAYHQVQPGSAQNAAIKIYIIYIFSIYHQDILLVLGTYIAYKGWERSTLVLSNYAGDGEGLVL